MAFIPKHVRALLGSIVTSPDKETSRLRVDSGQTGFWENREFRIFQPIDTSGGNVVIKIIAPINFILRWQALQGKEGIVNMKAYRLGEGTEGGTFTDTIYKLPNNIMSDAPAYTPQVQYQTGGTFTPTTPANYKDILEVQVANATAQASTVGSASVPERGLAANTYYLVFSGGGKANFFSIIEERP